MPKFNLGKCIIINWNSKDNKIVAPVVSWSLLGDYQYLPSASTKHRGENSEQDPHCVTNIASDLKSPKDMIST